MALLKFDVLNRFSGAVQFTAELECDEDAPPRVKLGLSVKWAYKSGADLGGADLGGAYLRGADLGGADLRGADLRGADLRGADLGGADLRGAYLRGANLGGAYLRGADLGGADLRGADLGGAYLRGHKVNGDIGLIEAGTANNWAVLGFVDADTGALHVCVGCQNKEIGEGRDYWSSDNHPEQENRREVLAALDYVEAVARLRGWTGASVSAETAA